jgi:hypothetical protein
MLIMRAQRLAMDTTEFIAEITMQDEVSSSSHTAFAPQGIIKRCFCFRRVSV